MKIIKKYFMISMGVVLVALAVSVFYTPNKIVSGGVSGISTILFYTFGIQPGVSYAIINIVLLILALKYLGITFVKDTLLGAMLLSVLVQAFTYIPAITTDIFLAMICGSFLYGLGIGITLVEGASTGGTDILSRLVQCVFPHVKIGNMLLIVDMVVIVLSFCVFRDFDLVMYGGLALCFASFSINILIHKLNVSKLAFVVSDKGIDISKVLVENSPRGVTIIDSIGAYTMERKEVLICALKMKLRCFKNKYWIWMNMRLLFFRNHNR